jgi:hypothetical protein
VRGIEAADGFVELFPEDEFKVLHWAARKCSQGTGKILQLGHSLLNHLQPK